MGRKKSRNRVGQDEGVWRDILRECDVPMQSLIGPRLTASSDCEELL